MRLGWSCAGAGSLRRRSGSRRSFRRCPLLFQLVRRYGTLDGVLDAGLFPTQAEALRVYRLIATMDAAAPLPSLCDQAPTWASASSLVRSWRLKQFADRLAEKA
jgi:hypothetical protein